MAISKTQLEKIMNKHFPDAIIKIKDIVGDSNHYSLYIKDRSFKNISLIHQHKIVNKVLYKILKTKLHAITIKTDT